MNRDQIKTRLAAWAKHAKAVDAQYDAYHDLTGSMPDSALWEPIFGMMAAYTKEVGAIVGDNGEWMGYFHLECKMGKNPLSVWLSNGTEFKMRTIKDLVRVIADK